MKQLYLKNQAEKIKLENVRKYKVDEHNFLVDEQKKAKKAKDTEAHARATTQLEKVRTDIVGIDEQLRNIAEEFNRLAPKLGKLRLDLYVFADVLYNTLIEYEEFRNKYVVNKDDDADVFTALTTAIDNITVRNGRRKLYKQPLLYGDRKVHGTLENNQGRRFSGSITRSR